MYILICHILCMFAVLDHSCLRTKSGIHKWRCNELGQFNVLHQIRTQICLLLAPYTPTALPDTGRSLPLSIALFLFEILYVYMQWSRNGSTNNVGIASVKKWMFSLVDFLVFEALSLAVSLYLSSTFGSTTGIKCLAYHAVGWSPWP